MFGLGEFSTPIVAIVSAVIGLAIVAVIVGQNAQTSTVIQSSGSALSSIINAAVSPVSGGGTNGLNLSSNTAGSIVNGGFGPVGGL